jgi:hypothetical protein
MPTILASELQRGDLFYYENGDYTYIVWQRKSSKKHKTRIVLVRVEEKNGIKKYSRRPKTDFIHEINDEGNISEHWNQPVILKAQNQPIPQEEQIQIL